MESRIDEISLLAGELETQIRAGEPRRVTRATYERLLGLREDVLRLAIHHDVPIDPVDGEQFRLLIEELDRYYR